MRRPIYGAYERIAQISGTKSPEFPMSYSEFSKSVQLYYTLVIAIFRQNNS